MQLEVQVWVRIARIALGRWASMIAVASDLVAEGSYGSSNSDLDLYNQLRYFESLFPSEKAFNGNPKYGMSLSLLVWLLFLMFLLNRQSQGHDENLCMPNVLVHND